MAPSANDLAVLRSTRALLAAVSRQTPQGYADPDYSPAGDLTLELIARSFGCRVVVDTIEGHAQEVGVPGYFGPPMIIVNSLIPPVQRRLALRHGLAHLVAGELDVEAGTDVRFMSSMTDASTLEERRADLFALADLFPDRCMDVLTATGAPPRKIEAELQRQLRVFAPDWPRARLVDRVQLRCALYADRRE